MLLSNRYKVRASSITESVIAMTIVAICVSIAIIMYGRVLRTDTNMAGYKAQQKVKELLWEVKNDKNKLEDESYDFGSFSVDKKIEKTENKNSYKITFTIKLNNQKKEYFHIVTY